LNLFRIVLSKSELDPCNSYEFSKYTYPCVLSFKFFKFSVLQCWGLVSRGEGWWSVIRSYVRPPRSHDPKTYHSTAPEKFFMPHACFIYVISLVECSKHGDALQNWRPEFESTKKFYVCLVSLMALVISWWNYTVSNVVTHCWR
jgi:hypothetical protein